MRQGDVFTGWRIAFFLLCGACLAAPRAATAQTEIGYRVNVDSFDGFFDDDPTANPVPAIRFALSQWTATGGIEQHFVYQGTTTRTGCGFLNPNFVVAREGCHSAGCDIVGSFTNCLFGGWIIRLWEGSGFTWVIEDPRAGQLDVDFHSTLLHEIGHLGFVNNEHVGGDICVMNADSLPGVLQRFFCRNEMSLMDDRFGLLQLPMRYLLSEGDPAPTSWSSHSVSGNNLAGRGFLDFQEIIDVIGTEPVLVVANAYSTFLFETEYPHLSWSPLSGQSQMRPTVALDTDRNRFWLFWREDTDSGRNAVQYASRHVSGSSWTFHGRIPNVETRVPVAASYDWKRDRIVVVYVQWSDGTVWVTSAPASTPFWRAPEMINNFRAVGVPAMACEHSFWARRCEVAVASSHRFRNFRTFGFGLSSTGAIEHVSSVGLMNVRSSFPPGMTYNGRYSQGYFTFAFRNDPDGLVRYRKKPNASSWWDPAQSTGFYAGSAGTPIQLFDDAVGGGYWSYVIFNADPTE